MFCADNYIVDKKFFAQVKGFFDVNKMMVGLYTRHYALVKHDNSLNRYFSLIGGNDPVSFYLGKNDRLSYQYLDRPLFFDYLIFQNNVPSLGDNGCFYWRDKILKADLDHYYPMDCAVDLINKGHNRFIRLNFLAIWHRTTDGNLLTFLKRRYRYARDLYCDRDDRRWKMVSTTQDYWRLAYFIGCTLTIIPLLLFSIQGFSKVKDWAWFWHPIACWGFLLTYGYLACRNLLKYRSLSQLFSVQRA